MAVGDEEIEVALPGRGIATRWRFPAGEFIGVCVSLVNQSGAIC